MNRLTALDVVRAKWGPDAYAEYRWYRTRPQAEPMCAVTDGKTEWVAGTFRAALRQAGITVNH